MAELTGNLMEVSAAAEYEVMSASKKQRMLVMSHLDAPTLVAKEGEEERAPVSVSCVIDKSGSMSPHMKLVKEAMGFVIDSLQENDHFGVVTYDSATSVLCPMTKMTPQARMETLQKVQRITPGSLTDINAGLGAGVQMSANSEFGVAWGAREAIKIPETASRCVWMFTDGEATSGTIETPTIIENLKRGKPEATMVYTFGLGRQHKAELLKGLADAGHGMYYYLENSEAVGPAFAECLGGLLSTVAKDISVKFEACPGVTIAKAHGNGTVAPDGKSASFKLKDLFSEETRDLLVEVDLDPTEPTDKQDLVSVTVDYKDSDLVVQQCTTSISVARCAPEGEADILASRTVNVKLDEQRNRIRAAEAMEEAHKIANLGDFNRARARINECIEEVSRSATGANKLSRDIVADMGVCEARVTPSAWGSGSKMLAQAQHIQQHQRGCYNAAFGSAYQTAPQAKMMQQQQQQPQPQVTIPVRHQPYPQQPFPQQSSPQPVHFSFGFGKPTPAPQKP